MVNPYENRYRLQPKTLGWGAASLALLTAVLAACAPETQTPTEPQAQDPATEQPEATTEPQEPVTSEDVSQDPEELIGQTVTIRGTINERLSENVVTLDGEGLFAGEQILVVLPENFTPPGEGEGATDSIQVTGEVRQFTTAEAQQLNLDIPQDQLSNYEENPIIVAETAALSPSPDELSETPEAFYNQTIALEGGIEELGPNTYRLIGEGVGGEDLLIVSAQPLQESAEELDEVVVTGQAQQFNIAELQQEYNWDPELQQQLTEDYADKPVIIANEIYPLEK